MIIIGTVAGRGTFAVVSRHKMAGRGDFCGREPVPERAAEAAAAGSC